MDDPDSLIEKAKASSWGYIRFPRGTVLFMRLNSEQVVLVEPDGGYFYPFRERINLIEVPNQKVLASALTGLSPRVLDSIAKFTSQPRTIREIEERFSDVQAWRLRRLGFLADAGRRERRIVSQWVGYDLSKLLHLVFDLAKVGSRQINS